jgi:hypothetical protein
MTMTIIDTDKLFNKLDEMGVEKVRLSLAQGVFAPQKKIDLVNYWLNQKENKEGHKPKNKEEVMPLESSNTWRKIEKDYEVTKRMFGKRINFVSDPFKRNIIFRDIGHAYILANNGLSKPAVILAGSVIEELLRLYLQHNGISPSKNTFNSYIRACEANGLLKDAIQRLSDSVRYFRNLVHLSKEKSKRETISKATAIGAVSSIFTIANDF